MVRKSETTTETDPTTATKPGPTGPPPEPAFVDQVGAHIQELKKQLLDFWAIKVAEMKLAIWKKFFGALACGVGAIFVAAFSSVGAYYVLSGVADGLTQALSSRWLGSLFTGLAALSAVVVALFLARRVITRSVIRQARGEKRDD